MSKIGEILVKHKSGATSKADIFDGVEAIEISLRNQLVRRISVIAPGSDVIELPDIEEKSE